MKRILIALALAPLCFGGLTNPLVSNTLTAPADWSFFFANGSMSETVDGLTSGTNGSLIYGASLPGNYEVRSRYKLTNNGGSYVTYVRASSDANLQANTGTFYAIEITNVTVAGGGCTATLKLWQRNSSGSNQIVSTTVVCAQDMQTAVMVRDSKLIAYRPDTGQAQLNYDLPSVYPNPSLATVQAGVGVGSTPAASGITRLDIYAIETTPPRAPNVPMTSTSGAKIEMQWQGTVDDGSGLMFYEVWRRPIADPNGWVLRGSMTGPAFVDRDQITNGATYSYLIRAYDYHQNFSDSTQFGVSVPPAGAYDPRQIGIRPTGAYWGAGGEQIDMQSGNLNYTLPILQAKARGGMSATFGLNFNSQMWRKDLVTNGTWYYGRDVGFGHGWRLLAGSIMPVFRGSYELSMFIFTDSTGAEYRLDVNSGTVWTTKEGLFVSYDAATQRVYFNDGTFWYMGAESGGTEFDAGVRYPTLMSDSNGNQIGILYQTGVDSPYANSSSRVTSISDITGIFSLFYTPDQRLSSISHSVGAVSWNFTYGTSTANSPWEPNQNPQNVVQALLSATNNQIGGTYNFTYYATGELGTVTLPFGGRMRWTYGEWTSSSQRIVREVNQRWLMTSPGATETAHYLSWDASDANFEYHQVRIVSDQTNAYDKIWWFNSSRQLQTFDERKQPGSNIRVRKYFTWALTPSSQQPYITQVDTTPEASSASPLQKRSTQILDAYGNVTEAREYDYGVVNYRKYTMQYLTDANYTTRFIRNRLTSLSLSVNGGVATTLLTKGYDHAAFGSCGYQGGYGNYPLLPSVALHDDANYGLSFPYRGNVTGSTSSNTTVCQLVDYLGTVRSATGPFGTTTTTPDATKQYAVPSTITANGYSTSLQWDSLLNLTQSTGPNNATMSFGYDVASRPASTQGVDGDSVTYTYSTPNRYSMATSAKKFTKTTVDGLGRTVKVEAGYNPSPGTSVVESVVDTEYAPCACTPMGKMKRVSQPYKPGNPVVWTTYTYDELGRVLTVTHPPNTGSSGNSGTTSYVYYANTVKITDPASRWKKYTMDGYGNLTRVDEPKPAGGTYVTTYTYSEFNQLKMVSMTRDGYNGNTPVSVAQTRTFAYDGNQRLQSTTFPETPGSTTYTYNSDGMLFTKTDYKGVRKYFYTTAKQLQRVEKYPGGGAEDVNARVTYYYDSHPFTTTFVSQYTQGRLAAISYGGVMEFYSYTRGGRLVKKRLESQGVLLEVGFEYDAEAKLQYMVYPSGTRVKYTYDDLARHTGLKSVQGVTETDIVNNLTYGAAGELKSMSWSGTGGWATQTWAFNNRLQMTDYTYGGPGGSINHSYLYSTTANDGKLWRRQDNVSGEVVEYQYDSIHRLISAGTVTGTAWSQSFVYDGFGNMKQKTGTGLAVGTSFNISLNSAKNGGGTGDPGDIDNRILTSLTGETYSYAPDNKRITKMVPGVQGTQWFLWVGGMRIGTYTHNWNSGTSQWVLAGSKEDWYVAGRRVAPSDRLGSDLTSGLKLMPYGEEIQPPNVPNDRTKFATYHRDASGLDYADQRYYAPGSGRFLTADPYVASGGPGTPNSWNRFAYVESDPVNAVDPTGENLAHLIPAEGGGGGGGLFHWPFPFAVFGLGKILGGLFGGGGDPVVESWRNNPGANVAAQDKRIAEDKDRGEDQDRRYVAALKVVGDCYQTSTLGGAVVRRFQYLPVDQYGQGFARGEVTITESIVVTQGSTVTAGAPWTPDKMNPDGSFYDYVSKFYRGNNDVVMYQTFQATMLNSAGFAPGVPRAVMVHYDGYGSGDFGTWGHWATNDGVRTNGYFYDPGVGRTTCPNPRFP